MKKTLLFLIFALVLSGFFLSCKKLVRITLVKTVSVNETTLLVKGELVDAGDEEMNYGFCWSTTTNPTISDQKIIIGHSSTNLTYQTTLSGLTQGTKYYIRAVAFGESGTYYGDVISFIAPGGTVDFIYDDGTADNGWRYNPGYAGSLGNLFPASSFSGMITAIKLYFSKSVDAGTGTLTIDVYNSAQVKIGGVAAFTPPSDAWITRSSNITFNGDFYVMAVWQTTTGYTHYLGIDENGPHVLMDLAYFRNSLGEWGKLSGEGNPPGIFLLRVTVALFKSNSIPVLTEFDATSQAQMPSRAGLQRHF